MKTLRLLNYAFVLFGLFGIGSINQMQAQTCLPGGITFTTQAQIDNFATNYPGCTQILGDVIIQASGPAINNLSGLSQISIIDGALEIKNNSALVNLNGLENLTSVGKQFWIYFNANLADISSLSNLTSIGFELNIYFNSALASLTGLENLGTIGGYCNIDSNIALTDLTGLDNLSTVGLTLKVIANTSLNTLNGLHNLATVGSDLLIQANNNLIDLTGLGNLLTIGGIFTVQQSAGLINLKGLTLLNYIGGYLKVASNNALVDVSGLEKVTELGGGIIIENNGELTNIVSLESITSINGFIRLQNNDKLCSLAGLDNINHTGITNLTLRTSAVLALCDVPSICNYLAGAGSSTISGNTIGCNSSTGINIACGEGYPEIDISGNASPITDGSVTPLVINDTDYGNVDINAGSVNHTITINNTGADTLKVFSAIISGTDAADFTISGISSPLTISNGNNATFILAFDPTTVGLKTAMITINNNDSDETIYTFAIEGNATNCTASTCTSTSPLVTVPGIYQSYLSQTDGGGWTHYCDCDGKLLLSLEIGTSGAVIAADEVTLDLGAGPNFYNANVGFISNPDGIGMMNRRWEVDPTTQPGAGNPVGVRFYYTDSEYNGINGLLTGMNPTWGIGTVDEMNFFKVSNQALGAFPPIANIGTSDVIILTNAATPAVADTTSWKPGLHGSVDHFAEFKVSSFSGGGGGAGGGSGGLGFLPVELIFFNAIRALNKVNIDWATATEINNDGYDIERSKDGENFEKIGFVRGRGTSTETHHYSFSDNDPNKGANYYRLKILDLDGQFEYSAIRFVFFAEGLTVSTVFPNPAKKGAATYLGLELEKEAKVNLRIFNTAGKLLQKSQQIAVEGYNNLAIDTKDLLEGIYFLEVEIDGLLHRQKLVVSEP